MERYEAYKDSGVEWIGEIPEGWTADKVIRLFKTVGSGTTPKTDNEAYYDGNIPWVQSGDLVGWRIADTAKTVTEEAIRDVSALTIYRAPYIAIAMYGASIGNMSIVDTHSCVNQACCVLSDCKGSMSYYAYVIDSAKKHLIDQGIGGTQPNISQQVIKRLWLPRPSLVEQQAIADYLDAKTGEIDALVADCEREVGLLQEYRKAVISEAVIKGLDPDAPMKDSGVEWIGKIPVNWVCSSLNRVIKTIQTGPFGSQLHAEDYSDDGEVCVVNPANIVGGKIVPSTCNRISDDLASSLSQHLMRKGEIVFGRRGEMGRCALVEEDGLFCGTGSIEMELLEIAMPAFAVYYLQCDFVKSYLELRSVGTTLQNLNTGIIASTPFVIAPVAEQEAIVTYLDARTAEIDSLIEAKQAMVEKLREYRKSLISEAVTGKFKVPGA